MMDSEMRVCRIIAELHRMGYLVHMNYESMNGNILIFTCDNNNYEYMTEYYFLPLVLPLRRIISFTITNFNIPVNGVIDYYKRIIIE